MRDPSGPGSAAGGLRVPQPLLRLPAAARPGAAAEDARVRGCSRRGAGGAKTSGGLSAGSGAPYYLLALRLPRHQGPVRDRWDIIGNSTCWC